MVYTRLSLMTVDLQAKMSERHCLLLPFPTDRYVCDVQTLLALLARLERTFGSIESPEFWRNSLVGSTGMK